MARTLASAFLIVLFLPGCADSIAPPEKLALPTPTKQPVSFNEDIHPASARFTPLSATARISQAGIFDINRYKNL